MINDMYKISKETRPDPRFDMDVDQWSELIDKASEGISGSAEAVKIAFRYGYEMGRRSSGKAGSSVQ